MKHLLSLLQLMPGMLEDEAATLIAEYTDAMVLMRKLCRTSARGESLYATLLREGERVVSLKQLELENGMRFAVVPSSDAVYDARALHDDPNYSRPLFHAICSSLSAFVLQLDALLASLPGLHECDMRTSVAEEVACARQLITQELGRMMVDVNGSQQAMLDRCIELRTVLVERTLAAQRRHAQRCIGSIRCLGRLCAAARKERSVAAVFQTEVAGIRNVCATPPACLTEELRSRGLSLHVLQAAVSQGLFCGTTQGFSMLPPSIGRGVCMLEAYLGTDDVALHFEAACERAVQRLCWHKQIADSSPLWHGIAVCDAHAAHHASATLGIGSAMPLVGPSHVQPHTGLYIVATPPRGSALRVVRLAHAIVEVARLGVLPIGVVRADIVLRSVARSRGDLQFRIEQLGYATPVPPDDAPLLPRLVTRATEAHGATRIVLAERADACSLCPESVHQGLRATYHMLSAMRRVRCDAHIPLHAVVCLLRAQGGYFSRLAEHGVKCRVAHTARKFVALYRRSCAQNTENTLMRYEAARTRRATSCIEFGSSEGRRVNAFLEQKMSRMAAPDAECVHEWVSKSTRKRVQRMRS